MKLHQLDNNLKYFLSLFLIVMTIGVTIGLIYVRSTTNISAEGTVHRYAGSEAKDEFDITNNTDEEQKLFDMLETWKEKLKSNCKEHFSGDYNA